MMTDNSMICDKCGKVFPLFNNELVLQANKYSMGWHHICKECLQKEDKVFYSTTTNNFDLNKYSKEMEINNGK